MIIEKEFLEIFENTASEPGKTYFKGYTDSDYMGEGWVYFVTEIDFNIVKRVMEATPQQDASSFSQIQICSEKEAMHNGYEKI